MTCVVSASSFSISPREKSQEGKQQQQKVVERTFGMANWRRKFSLPPRRVKEETLSRSNARRKTKKANNDLPSRRVAWPLLAPFLSRAVVVEVSPKFEFRWRDFWKTKIERNPLFSASTCSVVCACARVQNKTRKKRETSNSYSLFLFFYSFLMDSKRCALRKLRGAFVNACKCVPHFAPNISRDICNFFFLIWTKRRYFSSYTSAPFLLKNTPSTRE